VTWLSDATVAHLCSVADWPDLSGTRYEVLQKIGQGGMGTVFLARDRELDRAVALKVLTTAPDNADAIARMVTEARITARLEHPSIVPVHDAGVLPDGRFYYAMKLVRGKRLDEQHHGRQELSERLQLFQKICDAVAFAHAHGFIHRDLKPQNIMLGPFGEVLVLDWGVAKQIGATPSRNDDGGKLPTAQTASGTVIGTPGYMAPEQARGDANLDESADVYALGAILYFLLSGRAPVHESLLPDSGKAVATVVTPPCRFDPSIPRSLQAICLKALATDRTRRYRGASELSADVADFLAGRRVRAYPEGIVGAALRLGTKYRAVLALLMAYLVIRIVLLIVFRS
jgi:serine/threonine protein kinase